MDVGSYKLHIHCVGQGSPTVVLDSLGDGTSVHWAWVQPEIAKTTRVCAYDRARRGWSEAGSGTRDARRAANDLHALLHNAGVPGPYILAGHSYGAAVARLYADQYPDEVVGMALIDGALPDMSSARFPPEELAKAAQEHQFMAIAPLLARFGVFRLVGPLPVALPPAAQAKYEAMYASTSL